VSWQGVIRTPGKMTTYDSEGKKLLAYASDVDKFFQTLASMNFHAPNQKATWDGWKKNQ
jgi:hypothetical protein